VALNSAKVPNALLAGRTLLLADDSITIQKVVELTFSDEGVSVVCVSNGREAIERLENLKPDVVLADVVMPEPNGYEICEYLKQNEKLKHIPVMLLVGSFEPFDEAEARRVGADDTLTKPFQSIRRLLDKVGTLVGRSPSEEQIPTAELPRAEPEPEPEALTEQQLEITTADTQPLPPDLGQAIEPQLPGTTKVQLPTDTKLDEAKMDRVTETKTPQAERHGSTHDVLLDLGHFEPIRAEDEFVLDIDLDEAPEPASEGSSLSSFAGRQSYPVGVRELKTVDGGSPDRAPLTSSWSQPDVVEPPIATADQFAKTQEFPRPIVTPTQEPEIAGANAGVEQAQQAAASTVAGGQISLEQLSPEVIDAIARRAVEQLSEKVVQEIAWEVVPQLAELLIKRQLEEKSS
jgi:CheY-like chemotaxis protein